MDILYAEAMTYPVPDIYDSVGGQLRIGLDNHEPSPGDAYREWLEYVLSQPYIPQTISVSYGIAERNVPPEYAMALCVLFAHLGARGTSVLFASGDNGVGLGDCKDGSGNVQFAPLFPGPVGVALYLSSQAVHKHIKQFAYQTSTVSQVSELPASVAGNGPEVAASLSGGDFSKFSTPPIPGCCCAHLPPASRQPVWWLVQVRFLL